MSVPHTDPQGTQPAPKQNKTQKKIDNLRLFILTKQAQELAENEERRNRIIAPCTTCRGGYSFWGDVLTYCGIGLFLGLVFLAISKNNQ